MADTELRRQANFSRCRQYRYALWRQWGDNQRGDNKWDDDEPFVLILGLNPSTADHRQDDPTIRRCIGFAKSWGYQRLCVANLFAYRATYPKDLFSADDPIGPKNDAWLRRLARNSDKVIAAWGSHGHFLDRDTHVLRYLTHLHAIRVNQSGSPAHPLYLPKHLTPSPWLPATN